MLYSASIKGSLIHAEKHTVVNWPPERIWLIDLAIEGFSATQSTLIESFKFL